jgi:hypothetical protein
MKGTGSNTSKLSPEKKGDVKKLKEITKKPTLM